MLFAAFGHMGLRTLTIREVSRNREDSIEYLSRIVPPRLAFLISTGCLIPFAAILLDYSERTILAITIAAFSYVFDQISRIVLDVFQAFEEMGKIAFRDVFVRIITGVSSFVALYCGFGLYSVCLIYTLGAFIGLIINIILYSKRFQWPRLKFDFDFIYRNLKEGSPFLFTGFVGILLIKADILIISKLLGVSSVGTYNAAANLYYRLTFVCDAIATASFPAISQLFWTDKKEAISVFNKSLQYIAILGVPMAAGGILLSDSIIYLIYGKGYYLTVPIFCVLVCGTPIMFINTLLNYTLGAIREQKFVLVVISFLAVFNIVANFILLPLYGEIGAAYSTFFSHVAGILLLGGKIFKNFGLNLDRKILFSILISTTLLAIVLYFVKPFGIIASLLAGCLIYLGSLTLFSGSSIDIKKLLKLKV